jgi:hypothetical protein
VRPSTSTGRSAARRHFRPRVEALEARLALAGLFNEDFSSDAAPANPGFDTAADGFAITNDLPPARPDGAQTGRGGIFYLLPGTPGDPGWGLFADGHILLMLASNFSVPQVTFRYPAAGLPGGPAADEAVSGVGLSVQGFGQVQVQGEFGTKVVNFTSGNTWQRIVADRGEVLPSGLELGAIQAVRVFSSEYVGVDIVSMQVSGATSNHPPIANDDVILVDKRFGQSEIFNPIGNDTDPDNDFIAIIRQSQHGAQHGTVTEFFDQFNNFRGYRYDASPDALRDPNLREDSFTYVIQDTLSATDQGRVRLVINTPPHASFDEYELPHGFSGAFGSDRFGGRGLLNNDGDADQGALSVIGHGQPQFGTVTVSPGGGWQYTPTTPGGLVRPDSFTYEISDGHVTVQGEAFIRVPNSAPVATGGPIVAPHNAPAPLAGSFPTFDAEGDALTAVLVEDGAHGSVTRLAVVGGRVEIEYQTGLGVVRGTDFFSYRLFDGYDYSAPVVVEIRVPNHPPVAHPDFYWPSDVEGFLRLENGNAYLVGNVLRGARIWTPNDFPPEVFASIDQGEDRDADGDELQVLQLTAQPAFGTLISLQADGRFVYELPPDWNKPPGDIPFFDWSKVVDSFRYSVSDGHSSSETTAYLYRNVNPRVLHPLKYEVVSGQTLFVPREIGLTSDASEAFGFDFTIENLPQHGTLMANANGTFHYQSQPGFVGTDTFLIHITSFHHIIPRPVTIVVQNRAPQTLSDFYWAKGDQDLIVSAASGVLANDSDPDGHAPRLDFLGTPARGQILRRGDDGSFTYRPAAGFRGTDTFSYQVSDVYGGIAQGTITVQVLAPTAAGELVNLFTPSGHHVALQSSSGTTLANVSVTNTPPGNPPASAQFPLGYFRFDVRGVAVGGAATVRVLLPSDAPAVNEYWKFGPTPGDPSQHWYRFVTSAPAADEFPGVIVLPLVDGGSGDSDRAADGVIVDPGGPAFLESHAPRVASVVVNNGHAQRSMVTSLTITFDEVVSAPLSAFELKKVGAKKAVALKSTVSTSGGQTVVRLTFKSGSDVTHSSLKDGTFRLTIRGDRVRSTAGDLLDGNGDGQPGGNHVAELFRLFGDSDGDRDLDLLDQQTFNSVYGKRSRDAGYLWYLDSNANGRIWAEDLALFVLGYGRSVKSR